MPSQSCPNSINKVPDNLIKRIDDVFAEDGNYTTDGCSPIREKSAKEICRKLDIPSNTSGTVALSPS